MAITNITYSNTFFQWVNATNEVVDKVNLIDEGNYTKSTGTLTLSSPGTSLIVANAASFYSTTSFTSNVNVSGTTSLRTTNFASGTINIANTSNLNSYSNTFFEGFVTSNNYISIRNAQANGIITFSNTANVIYNSNTTFNTDTVLKANNNVSGNVNITGTLYVPGNTIITGNTTLSSNIYGTITYTAGSNTTFSGNTIFVSNTLFSNANVTGQLIANNSTTTNANVSSLVVINSITNTANIASLNVSSAIINTANVSGLAVSNSYITNANVYSLLTANNLTVTANTRLIGTGYVKIPVGTTAERPAPEQGFIRFNSSLVQFEGYNGSAWGTIGGGATGGVGNAVFYENDQNVTSDYTITSGKNAMSAGPITIASGTTVTIPTGSVWTIV